ncbi:MAG: addiction module protein [Acidobacteriota bacterium]
MPKLEELTAEALGLEVRERAKLAERLLDSLDGLSEDEIEALWAEEAERRLQDLRGGRVRGVSAERVREELENLVR